jgi:hypothetical protein
VIEEAEPLNKIFSIKTTNSVVFMLVVS